MAAVKLSRIGELALLEQIRKNFSEKSGNVLVGIGDDAAVVKPVNMQLLVTTDMMVEGVHFDLRFSTPYQLGFKLISANVSDIYAMGGRPFYFLLNIAANKNTAKGFIDMLFKGVKDAMHMYRTCLIGGDLSAAEKGMYFSATLIGYARKSIKRAGAKIGDRIYVTGTLGDSACGLELLKKMKRPSPLEMRRSAQALSNEISGSGLSWKMLEPLLRRHLLPVARNPERYVHAATAMIDISDGLLIDLTRLCDESRVGARLYEENIPLSPGLKKAASYLGISPLTLSLSGGEDYELLFTAPPRKKVKAIYIGDIVESKRVIVDTFGKEKRFSAEGYRHFG
jgi:thiamine-monophosphate kinase